MLVVSNLKVWYGATEVLKDVSFSVPALSIVALLGGNGSGKSTVVNTICGLISPRHGRIAWRGKDIASKSVDKLVRAGVVQIPQGREVFATMTVSENLEMGAHSRTLVESKKTIEEMFNIFPMLRDKHRHRASLLSGGEQQQLAIARALMSKPELLLMDEPTVGLSPAMVDRTIETIKQLRELGLTILLVEQNVGVAAALAEMAYVLRDGAIAFGGPAKELISQEEVLSSYLGH